MLESEIEQYLVALVNTSGGLCVKLVASGKRGWPDRIVLLPGGRVWFVELKRPGEKPRGQQLLRHAELAALGFPVVVLDTKEKVKDFVEQIQSP